MKVVEDPHTAYAHAEHWRRDGRKLGLVPTMGALHEGHLSLVRRSVEECEITMATIFVNPTQFGPHEDFAKYPRTLETDLAALRGEGVDLVFVPEKSHLYPPGFSTQIQPPRVAQPLEGVHRPGHFPGVCTIVLKLFQILPADCAYFGTKDFQQFTVIRQMAEDLNLPLRIVPCETVRESDGLAMSSRNRYLETRERGIALSLYASLEAARTAVREGERNIEVLEKRMHESLYRGGVDRIDYARVVSRDSLEGLNLLDRPAQALVAAYVGDTRLIDNLALEP